jgi:hypothetical protein
MPKTVYSATDLFAAIQVATRFLPSFIITGGAYVAESARLEAAFKRYQEWGNPPSNWYGVLTKSSEEANSDSEYLDYLREHEPEHYNFTMEARARADAYSNLVRELCGRWRLKPDYGPHVIHSVVRSRVVYGPERLQGAAFLTRPRTFHLRFDIEPYARYEKPGPIEDFLPNVLRAYHGVEPLPSATWTAPDDGELEGELVVKVRDLPDLQQFMPSILRAFEEKSGLPLKRPRRDAYAKLGRDTRWFYLHHCEGKKLEEIAEGASTEDRHFDPSAVYKAIAGVRRLLANPDLRLT